MAIYIAREATKLWRKMSAEATVELQLLFKNWRLLLAGNMFQGVHYLHRPGPIFQEMGFMALQELGKDKGYLSETVFTSIFPTFVLPGAAHRRPQQPHVAGCTPPRRPNVAGSSVRSRSTSSATPRKVSSAALANKPSSCRFLGEEQQEHAPDLPRSSSASDAQGGDGTRQSGRQF